MSVWCVFMGAALKDRRGNRAEGDTLHRVPTLCQLNYGNPDSSTNPHTPCASEQTARAPCNAANVNSMPHTVGHSQGLNWAQRSGTFNSNEKNIQFQCLIMFRSLKKKKNLIQIK